MSLYSLAEIKASDVIDGVPPLNLYTIGGLASYVVEKGFDPEAVAMASTTGVFGEVMSPYFFGAEETNRFVTFDHEEREITLEGRAELNRAAQDILDRARTTRPIYGGSVEENTEYIINSRGHDASGARSKGLRRNGSNPRFMTRPDLTGGFEGLGDTPIAIVGAGAGGILTARALMEMGFTNLDIFDKRGRSGGIWEQDNVRLGSKNNPVDLEYDHAFAGSASISTDPSGTDIQDFIQQVAGQTPRRRLLTPFYRPYARQLPDITKGVVREIEPGDLAHTIRYTDQDRNDITRHYPIVVYAPGVGLPLAPNRPGHMETSAAGREAGQRWQRQLSREELRDLEGKKVVLIGLGNSTAEMIKQFEDHYAATGNAVDYTVLTHYSKEDLYAPLTKITSRISRNTREPELTKLALDLRPINTAYRLALRSGRIHGSIRRWDVERNVLTAEDENGTKYVLPYEALYTLIGYGQKPDAMASAGITPVNEYLGQGAFDFDGEVQREPGALGRQRTFPGYFAIGPILKNAGNPNAIVIPGIQYQLSEMLPSLTLRAVEHAHRHPDRLAEASKTRQPVRRTPQPDTLSTTAPDSLLVSTTTVFDGEAIRPASGLDRVENESDLDRLILLGLGRLVGLGVDYLDGEHARRAVQHTIEHEHAISSSTVDTAKRTRGLIDKLSAAPRRRTDQKRSRLLRGFISRKPLSKKLNADNTPADDNNSK